MTTLTRDMLLGTTAPTVAKPVIVNDDGDVVFVRQITGQQRECYRQRMQQLAGGEDKPIPNAMSELFILYACDADGKALFSPADIELVSNLPARMIDAVANAGLKLNMMDDEALENALKNWNAVPTDG